MKLNPDCIRDVLLVVETYAPLEYNDEVEFKELKEYTAEEILYHFRQCSKSHYIDGVKSYGEGIFVGDLSPAGHQFLANAESPKVWKATKAIAKEIGVQSLTALGQIAAGVVTQIIQNHFLPK